MTFLRIYANISKLSGTASKYPGVAKFGIALEWGSRGRWFESSHSDQLKIVESLENTTFSGLFLFFNDDK